MVNAIASHLGEQLNGLGRSRSGSPSDQHLALRQQAIGHRDAVVEQPHTEGPWDSGEGGGWQEAELGIGAQKQGALLADQRKLPPGTLAEVLPAAVEGVCSARIGNYGDASEGGAGIAASCWITKNCAK